MAQTQIQVYGSNDLKIHIGGFLISSYQTCTFKGFEGQDVVTKVAGGTGEITTGWFNGQKSYTCELVVLQGNESFTLLRDLQSKYNKLNRYSYSFIGNGCKVIGLGCIIGGAIDFVYNGDLTKDFPETTFRIILPLPDTYDFGSYESI